MKRRLALLFALLATLATTLFVSAAAGAHPGQHGPLEGHLIGEGAWGKIDFVGSVRMADAQEDLIADVTGFGDYAYPPTGGRPTAPDPRRAGRTPRTPART